MLFGRETDEPSSSQLNDNLPGFLAVRPLIDSNQMIDLSHCKDAFSTDYSNIVLPEQPEKLIFHLIRKDVNSFIQNAVKIDENGCVIIQHRGNSSYEITYEITHAILHTLGSGAGGHYTCIEKVNQEYLLHNDSRSTFVDFKKAIKLLQRSTTILLKKIASKPL